MKILVVGGNVQYASWILGNVEFIEPKLQNVEKTDVVYFTGGEDCDPSIYGCSRNAKTQSNIKRDHAEIKFYEKAKKLGKFIIGTCRGAQLITALQSRGMLIQHCDNHARGSVHEITFEDGDRAVATSTHHQMMYPFNVPHHVILAWASTPLSETYEFEPHSIITDLPGHREPEIVWYPQSWALAIQPHPEYMDKTCRLVLKLNDILTQRMPPFIER
jgi:gamma-glutamyl-gamma-aminobutyrate hydrolase PuuD